MIGLQLLAVSTQKKLIAVWRQLIAWNRRSNIKMFKQQEYGFTLVEILIVVAIMAVLAAVVVVSVVGIMGRGRDTAYAADERNLQTVVTAFYSDRHVYDPLNGWNEAGSAAPQSYHFPTRYGDYSTLYPGDVVNVGGQSVNLLMKAGAGSPSQATTADVADAAIWMGLLVSEPGSGTGKAPVADTKDNSAPLEGEHGQYLSKVPESCSAVYNSSLGKGTFAWIVGNCGRVYGVFEQGGVWYVGFSGAYP